MYQIFYRKNFFSGCVSYSTNYSIDWYTFSDKKQYELCAEVHTNRQLKNKNSKKEIIFLFHICKY